MNYCDVIKIKLESIASGGQALGRLEGKPVFVEGGAPCETVLCRIIKDYGTWAKAELLEITEASVVRTEPSCQFYAQCGGCNLQHIKYEEQLAVKENILKDSFERIGAFSPPVPEIFPSPPWEYRNRMQFHKNVNFNFGLMGRKKSKLQGAASSGTEIIDITDCPVADTGIRELLRKRGKTLSLPPEKDRFTVFSRNGLLLNEGGIERGTIKLLEKEVTLDAGVFFQSNIVMLEKLIVELRKTAVTADCSLPMADLYCGVGTFALFLGEMFPKVFLAEENKKAVSLARENLKGMNTEFFALRDTEWEKTILRQKMRFGFAVIDPPRQGLAPKLAAYLAREGAPLIAYVSCDTASLARDSKILTKGGYKLKEIKLFDFYPQTAHIETLAVFAR